MPRTFPTAVLRLAVSLCIALPASPASAYVPVARHLLSLAADRLGAPPPSVVRQVRIFTPQPPDPGRRQYREIVYLRFPGAFRSDLHTDGGRRVVLQQAGLQWTVVGGRLVEASPDPLDLALRIVVHNRPGGLARTLADEGVDMDVTSLGRFNGRLGFVLGARYPDESVPQLWFDKETLLPFRWLLIRSTEEGLPQSIEIRFFAWQKTGALQYPQAMACYQDQRLVSEVRVEKIESPAEVAETLFSIEQILRQTEPAPPPMGSSGVFERAGP